MQGKQAQGFVMSVGRYVCGVPPLWRFGFSVSGCGSGLWFRRRRVNSARPTLVWLAQNDIVQEFVYPQFSDSMSRSFAARCGGDTRRVPGA